MKTQVTSRQPERSNRGSWLLECLVILIIVLILAAILLPVTQRTHCDHRITDCMSNMTRIGRAMKMYLSDWDYRFPTNRPFVGNGKLGEIQHSIKLTPVNGKNQRFQYGVNWVESLNPYLDHLPDEPLSSIWQCPVVEQLHYKKESSTASVSYVFNRNLVELKKHSIRCDSNLMMMRETDRLVDAELRPTNNTTWSSKKAPISPFLTDHDKRLGDTKATLHRSGSHVLFVDGHVKLFDHSSYPSKLTKAKCWDPKTKQWLNNIDTSSSSPITITP